MKQRGRFDYFSSNAQGAQGSQMRIQSNQAPASFNDDTEVSPEHVGFPIGGKVDALNAFDPNTTQTNALLNIRDNRMNLFLQQVYYSEKCSWFYIGLLILSFGLVMVTVFDGF